MSRSAPESATRLVVAGFCPSCGAARQADWRFCASCGSALPEPKAPGA